MVETLGEALAQGWRIRAKCAWGKRDAMKSIRACIYAAELDLETLVWTRGGPYPLSDLPSRLKCPRCGSRKVALIFDIPQSPVRARA